MSSQKQAIARITGFMLILIPVIAAITAALYVIYWVAGTNVIWFGPDNAHNLVIYDAAPIAERRLVGILATGPAVISWLIALAHLFFLFRGFQGGAFIDTKAARRLRGYTFFAALAVLLDVAGSGARRWSQGEFSDAPLWTHIQISPEHLLLIFTAAIFYFISFILEYAKAYKDEAESYI